MSDDNDDTVQISSRANPETYVKKVIGQLNDGHDEVTLSAVGGAQENLYAVIGKLQVAATREDGVYDIPDISISEVESFTEEYDDEDGPSTASGLRVAVAQ
jgi:DNA-binding protein